MKLRWGIALSLGFALASQARISHGDDSAKKLAKSYENTRALQLRSVAKTQGLLADKYALREAEVKTRTRALYKLTRSSWGRLWVEPEARKRVSRWLGAARRIAKRDQRELALLRTEIALADAAEQNLEKAALHTSPTLPGPKSLHRPVSGPISARIGDFKGPSRGVVLRRRGIELKATSGDSISALAEGRVRYLGPIAGLGLGMITDHDGFISIIGHLKNSTVKSGDTILAGQSVGQASGSRIYLEMRIAVGDLGHPVDPKPYLSDK